MQINVMDFILAMGQAVETLDAMIAQFEADSDIAYDRGYQLAGAYLKGAAQGLRLFRQQWGRQKGGENMSEIVTGYLKRAHLVNTLTQRIEAESRRVIDPASANQGYEIGKQLGYTDAMKEVIKLVKELPDEPKPTHPRRILGRPETFGQE